MTTRPRVPAPAIQRRSLLVGAAALGLAGPGPARAADPLPKLRIRFDGQEALYGLIDHATTRDLLSLLPATLEITDFSTNEKIIHLPRRLDEGGFGPLENETPGDLCYFLGWGNLALFHDAYRFRDDLIRLGRLEGPVTPLLHKGTFPVRLERA